MYVGMKLIQGERFLQVGLIGDAVCDQYPSVGRLQAVFVLRHNHVCPRRATHSKTQPGCRNNRGRCNPAKRLHGSPEASRTIHLLGTRQERLQTSPSPFFRRAQSRVPRDGKSSGDRPVPVKWRCVMRLALGLSVLLIALLCSACLAGSGGNPDDNRPTVEIRSPSSDATAKTPAPSSEPSEAPKQATLPFGKSYAWRDGVSVTVAKPTKFTPSAFTVVDKSKRYVKFTVTVINKSNQPIDLGLTYIRVKSRNEEAHELFDSGSGLKGPPDTKVSKGRMSEFEVGFGVTDPKDVALEIALHGNYVRPSLLYST
jgi:hypothetical protein